MPPNFRTEPGAAATMIAYVGRVGSSWVLGVVAHVFRLLTDTHPASGSSRSKRPPHGSGRVPEPQTTSNVARPQDDCQPRMIQWSARSRFARTERNGHL